METKKKFSQEYVQNFFEQQGCELLDEYTGCLNLLKYRCKCGEISHIKFSNFKQGSRCEKCRRKNQSNSRILNHESVKEFFTKCGCELLDEYKSSSSKMKYRCVCGNESVTTWSHFKRGTLCGDCGIKKHSGDKHPKWIADREEVVRRRRLRSRYRNMLKRTYLLVGGTKETKSEKILGYTALDLQYHVQSYPGWDVISKNKWHLDHVFPIKAFLDHGIEDVAFINCLENIRPTTAPENLEKNDYYDVFVFRYWLKDRGWVYSNGKYYRPSKPIGVECKFYIPLTKHEIVKSKLHDYFLDNHGAYTFEFTNIKGFWKPLPNSLIQEDDHVKYICGIEECRLAQFVGFLREMCSMLQEQAIYLTMGHKSWLVLPPKEENEVSTEV